MERVGKGLVAGFVATVVLSALMMMKSAIGLTPGLDLPGMIAGMMGQTGAPAVGWAVHVMIGIVVYGLAMAWLDGRLPGGHTAEGMMLAVAGWLIMMIVLMPMAGAGLFGMSLGIVAPVMALILHLIFGAVLGSTYGWLLHRGHPTGAAHA